MTDHRLASLWNSDNPAYGVVRHAFSEGEYAARFDDLNGDYREVCLTILKWHREGWAEITSDDDCGLPEKGGWSNSGWANGYGGGHAYSIGRDDIDRWWLLVEPADEPSDVPFRRPAR
ncbi:hypothetical protein [Nocardioides sp. GCM10030258]|uniref:hypothetical protein n=1 Tax=unclassified Nocardioides TaxID=2615069 RepID=UPI0036240B12